jgi:ATP-dependent helicase/nuclease subunit B
MRQAFRLPEPERRIGQSAHDLAQAFAAPELILTRAGRVEGVSTVPARWLLRLQAMLEACGISEALAQPSHWNDWAALLDRPPLLQRPGPPAPRPPVAARPRQLSVTEIETWMRDPYAIYARHVLRLRALEPLDADPDAADYGSVVHAALDRFSKQHPRALPPDALDQLLATGESAFQAILDRPSAWAFWWPRFQRIAAWFVEQEGGRRREFARTLTEIRGTVVIPTGQPFILTAKADRIDIARDGGLVLVDYKTGSIPSPAEVAAGFAPQLPLEAAIAVAGGFADVPAGRIDALEYWALRGRDPAAEIKPIRDDVRTLADEALAGLRTLVAAFDNVETGYEARPRPDRAPRYSDYEHLARVREWSAPAVETEE